MENRISIGIITGLMLALIYCGLRIAELNKTIDENDKYYNEQILKRDYINEVNRQFMDSIQNKLNNYYLKKK